MSDFDSAERDFLYPADKIFRCAMCDEVIDVEDVLECIELGITSDEIEAFLSRCNGHK